MGKSPRPQSSNITRFTSAKPLAEVEVAVIYSQWCKTPLGLHLIASGMRGYVLSFLIDYNLTEAVKNEWFYCSDRKISRTLMLHPSHVRKIIFELKKSGYLATDVKRGRRCVKIDYAKLSADLKNARIKWDEENSSKKRK